MRLKIMLGAIAIIAYSCTDPGEVEQENLEGSWKVIAYENHETGLVLTKTNDNSDGGLDIEISFNDDFIPHTISGVNPPNQFYASYSYISSNSIQHSDFSTTEICCETEWGEYFISAILNGLSEYVLEADELRMYYNSKNNSVLFEKVE